LLAITFTWLMGLMGYFRSAIRQHWHVYGIIRDTSPDAFSPTLGYAANVVSVTTVIFLGFLLFIFWLGGLGDKKPARPRETGKGKG
jgi:cytochrome bd-type quinol oxidase subunit 1